MRPTSPSTPASRAKARRSGGLVACGVVAALALGLLAAVNAPLAIIALIGLGGIATLIPRPELTVAAFAASTFFERLSADFGLPVTPTKLLGILVLIAALVPLALRTSRRSWPTWQRHPVILVAAFGLGIWATASLAWATSLDQVEANATKLVTSLLVLVAVPLLVRSVAAMRTIGWWIASGGITGALLGMAMGSNLFGRAIGSFSDPNEFATATAAGAAFALALGETSPRIPVRWAGRIIACLSFVAVASSASRSGAAAILLAFLVLLFTARGVERLRMTGILLIGVSAACMWFMTAAGGQDAAQRFSAENSTGRTDLWRVARYQFEAHPITGVGLGNYPVLSSQYLRGDVRNLDLFLREARTVHNTPLELLAELGAVGFAFFYTIIFGCLAALVGALRRARRIADAALVGVCRGWLAATVAFLAASLTLSGVYTQLQWVLLGGCIAVASIARKREHEHLLDVTSALTPEPVREERVLLEPQPEHQLTA